jgi:hypothetical protein
MKLHFGGGGGGLHNLCCFRDPILLLHPAIGTGLSV